MPSRDAVRRFGAIVPLRLFGTAVKRNYARRRLREYFRRNKSRFPERCEILVRLYQRPADWDLLFKELERLLLLASRKLERAGHTPQRESHSP